MRNRILAVVLLLAVPAQAEPPVDPTGFTQALNVERAKRKLPPVAYDASLNGIAKQNNAAQAVKGQGHHVTGGHAQCSYVGPRNAIDALFGHRDREYVGIGYVDSPHHAEWLFHPKALRVGVDHVGRLNTIVIAFCR